MGNRKLEKYSRDNLITNDLSKTCNMCKKELNKNNKGIPCRTCKCRIHLKCAKITNTKDFHNYQGNWQCGVCIRETFPFADIDNDSYPSRLEF